MSNDTVTRLKPHQDYAVWEPQRGKRIYVTKKEWSDYCTEMALVLKVEGQVMECINCKSTDEVYKLTCDTPGFLASPIGQCIKCIMRKYTYVFNELDIKEAFWMAISEGGLAGDIMNMADVYPDNLGIDEDNEPYSYEAGDPVSWEQFSKESQEKIVAKWGGITGMLEKLHDEEFHNYCVEIDGEHQWSQ